MGCIQIFSIMYSDLCVSICACVKFCAILLHVDDDVLKTQNGDSPGGPVDKTPPARAGHRGLIPGLGRSHMPQSNKA